jgi:3-hydroxyacyl-[acyl-carrier-protein] dehydratase
MNPPDVRAAIPHRPPFLFVEEVREISRERIVCRKTFAPDEPFFAGHYPNFPLVPGVILCEAAMQAGAILLSQYVSVAEGVPVAARMNDVRFKRMVRPGETVELEARLQQRIRDAFFLKARVSCQGEVAVRFEFTCMLATSLDEPQQSSTG